MSPGLFFRSPQLSDLPLDRWRFFVLFRSPYSIHQFTEYGGECFPILLSLVFLCSTFLYDCLPLSLELVSAVHRQLEFLPQHASTWKHDNTNTNTFRPPKSAVSVTQSELRIPEQHQFRQALSSTLSTGSFTITNSLPRTPEQSRWIRDQAAMGRIAGMRLSRQQGGEASM